MWSLLHRNQESVLVGTAVTLVMLAALAHGRPASISETAQRDRSPAFRSELPRSSVFSSVPSDPAFYAAKWRQIANDFYAANPVHSAETTKESAAVVTAALNDETQASGDPNASVTPVSHSKVNPQPEPSVEPQSASIMRADSPTTALITTASQRVPVVGFPAVAASLAAGLLAWIAFRVTWPTVAIPLASRRYAVTADHADDPDSLRIELPSRWVRVRPPLRQRIKPFVLATSYLAGGFAAWMIMV